MNKNTIIALVIGLVIGGLAMWLFIFSVQDTGLGTAIGLKKSVTTTVDWNQYVVVPDGNHMTLKNGVTARKIDQTTSEIITPQQGGTKVKCQCMLSPDQCSTSGCTVSPNGEYCDGECAGSECGNTCNWHWPNGDPIVPPPFSDFWTK